VARGKIAVTSVSLEIKKKVKQINIGKKQKLSVT
jgi:hypothetical protein